MGLFFNVVLPIMAVFGAGYLLQRIRFVDVRSIATMSMHLFLPALVFTTLYEATFDQGYTMLVVFAFFILFMMILINKILTRIYKWTDSVESASILSTAFMNGGNYGVPVIVYTLGEAALPYAIFYMVLQTLIMNVVGVYYASRSRSGMWKASKTIFKLPATYAAVLAFLFQQIDWVIPEAVYSTLSMVAGAAIPVMMVLLGMQLASITSVNFNWQVIASASIVRMFLSPLIAFGFIMLLDIDPLICSVMLIVSAMPSAATTTMFAIEFDAEPDLVSSITLVTTLISIVSLTVLLNLMA